MVSGIITISLSSCLKDDEFRLEQNVTGTLRFLDIMDARALVVTAKGNTKSGTSKPGASLLKITESGQLVKVRYYRIDSLITQTQEGVFVETDSIELTDYVYPIQMVDLSSRYILASFGEENGQNEEQPFAYNFIVRKSDGSVFYFPGFIPVVQNDREDYSEMFYNEQSTIQEDNAGNLYYLGGWILHKLNVQNLANIRIEQLSYGGAEDGILNFRINKDQHMVFTTMDEEAPEGIKFRFSNGKIINSPREMIPYWLGFDESFYYSHLNEQGFPEIIKVIINNNEIAYESIGEFNNPALANVPLENGFQFKLEQLNKIIIVSNPNSTANSPVVTEVYNDEQTLKAFNLSELGLSSITRGVNNDNYYYLSGLDNGQHSLKKVDASVFPHNVVDLIPKGELEIFNMVVSAQNVITFHGIRPAGVNSILGEIAADGTITEFGEVTSEVFHLQNLE